MEEAIFKAVEWILAALLGALVFFVQKLITRMDEGLNVIHGLVIKVSMLEKHQEECMHFQREQTEKIHEVEKSIVKARQQRGLQ